MIRLAASLSMMAGAAIVLASCGGSDARLLPGTTARDITANLDAVKQLANEGDCLGAGNAARQVSEQVEALNGVDRKLKEALSQGASRLEEVVASCEQTTAEATGPTVPTEAETTTEKPPKKGKEPKAEGTAPAAPEAATPPSSLPPQANGKGKGLEKGEEPSGEEGVSPSGGVGPGTPVGEGN